VGADRAGRTRSFLTRAYPTMKKNNPATPIMLREAAGTLPRVYARYDYGLEKSQSLEGARPEPPNPVVPEDPFADDAFPLRRPLGQANRRGGDGLGQDGGMRSVGADCVYTTSREL